MFNCVCFSATGVVDTTMAGEGRLAVDVRGQLTRPMVNLAPKADGLYTVSFVPQECCSHTVLITFAGIPVPGTSLILPVTLGDLAD